MGGGGGPGGGGPRGRLRRAEGRERPLGVGGTIFSLRPSFLKCVHV